MREGSARNAGVRAPRACCTAGALHAGGACWACSMALRHGTGGPTCQADGLELHDVWMAQPPQHGGFLPQGTGGRAAGALVVGWGSAAGAAARAAGPQSSPGFQAHPQPNCPTDPTRMNSSWLCRRPPHSTTCGPGGQGRDSQIGGPQAQPAGCRFGVQQGQQAMAPGSRSPTLAAQSVWPPSMTLYTDPNAPEPAGGSGIRVLLGSAAQDRAGLKAWRSAVGTLQRPARLAGRPAGRRAAWHGTHPGRWAGHRGPAGTAPRSPPQPPASVSGGRPGHSLRPGAGGRRHQGRPCCIIAAVAQPPPPPPPSLPPPSPACSLTAGPRPRAPAPAPVPPLPPSGAAAAGRCWRL